MISELDRQIAETKIECIFEHDTILIDRLKKDDRTCIYSNFIRILEEESKKLLDEERRKWGI